MALEWETKSTLIPERNLIDYFSEASLAGYPFKIVHSAGEIYRHETEDPLDGRQRVHEGPVPANQVYVAFSAPDRGALETFEKRVIERILNK